MTNREIDVLVVGAGFAGAVAARELSRAHLRSVVLEARDRVGGRTWTSELGGDLVELGGTWIHWTQPHVWTEVTRHDLDLVETPGLAVPERLIAHSGGRLLGEVGPESALALLGAVEAYCAEARAIFPRPFSAVPPDGLAAADRRTAADPIATLGLGALERDLLDAYLATLAHNRTAAASWAEMLRVYALSGYTVQGFSDSLGRFRLARGTRALLEAILGETDVEIRLSKPVASLRQDSRGVTATTGAGEEIRARAALVTVPLNVLRTITFDPPLEAPRIEASTETHAGAGTKVVARLRGDYGVFLALAPPPSPLTALFTEHAANGETTVIGLGPDRLTVDPTRRDSVEAAIRTFLPDAEVLESAGHDWNADPYSRGTWCVFRPGQWTRHLAALQRPAGRIFFASADTANGWRGAIDGAIERGLRVAAELRKSL